ncbi:Fe-S cluster assembly protein SufD [Consotaella salsifontis]|uniref:Iron-regulated ABC transporter permease protein SufD n=1 Tax=Consotaella salsifontis TaxID=1365950 RepID=A0A1T4LRK9_9HYPH|nr:Fe-S cluster assembly protein SufD [Consotaella salsifontis]SJZ57323.1 Iron-regulated ABC transporter permease protein SufD [Consotaella salsifontis]
MSVTAPSRAFSQAEQSLVDRAAAALMRSAAGNSERQNALSMLKQEGLPSRRTEAWHYTDLRNLLGRVGSAGTGAPAGDADILAPLLPNGHVVEIGAATDVNPLAGVTVQQVDKLPEWKTALNHLDREFDTIRLLSVAFGAKATKIDVAAGETPGGSIELRAEPSASGSHTYAICDVGDEAKAVFVERLSATSAGSLATSVADLKIGDGAEVLWIVDQEKGAGETHLSQFNVTLGKDAKLLLFVLNAGGGLVRSEVHAITEGEGAEIRIRGVNLLKEGQHVDVTTTLNHLVPNTTATETFRNVVTGGQGVFQGMIRVSQDAQKTDAKMACNSLLLSDDGGFSAKPELEIFADDVQCGHGATAGEIDADHLFYLMSRGIPERQARALLVRAFVDEVVEEIDDEPVVEALEARIDRWLEAHG